MMMKSGLTLAFAAATSTVLVQDGQMITPVSALKLNMKLKGRGIFHFPTSWFTRRSKSVAVKTGAPNEETYLNLMTDTSSGSSLDVAVAPAPVNPVKVKRAKVGTEVQVFNNYVKDTIVAELNDLLTKQGTKPVKSGLNAKDYFEVEASTGKKGARSNISLAKRSPEVVEKLIMLNINVDALTGARKQLHKWAKDADYKARQLEKLGFDVNDINAKVIAPASTINELISNWTNYKAEEKEIEVQEEQVMVKKMVKKNIGLHLRKKEFFEASTAFKNIEKSL